MRTKICSSFTKLLFMFVALVGFSVPTVAFAADSTSIAVNAPTQVNSSPAPTSLSPVTSGALNVSPVSNGQMSAGFNRMGGDLATFAQSVGTPLFIFGILASVIMLVFGIFSSKLFKMGAFGIVGSFIGLLILGDVGKITNIFSYIAQTIRGYF